MYLIKVALLSSFLLLASCGMEGDINPSSADMRPTVTAGSIGWQVTQQAANFSAPETKGGTFTLSDYLAGGVNASDAVVFYFTMWCPICMGHTDHIYYNIMPQFQARGKTTYVLVDYVSGSIAATINAEAANGYKGSQFVTISDETGSISNTLHGSMGTTIVVDTNGIIQMNEDFRTGDNLIATLNRILP